MFKKSTPPPGLAVDPYVKNIKRMKERTEMVQEFCGSKSPVMTEDQFDLMLRMLCILFPAHANGMNLSCALDDAYKTYVTLSIRGDNGLEHLLKGAAVNNQGSPAALEAWIEAKRSFAAAVANEVGRRIMGVDLVKIDNGAAVEEGAGGVKEAEGAAGEEFDDMDTAE